MEAGESQTLCRQTSRQRLVLLACGLVFADVSLIFSILILLWDFFKVVVLWLFQEVEEGLGDWVFFCEFCDVKGEFALCERVLVS